MANEWGKEKGKRKKKMEDGDFAARSHFCRSREARFDRSSEYWCTDGCGRVEQKTGAAYVSVTPEPSDAATRSGSPRSRATQHTGLPSRRTPLST